MKRILRILGFTVLGIVLLFVGVFVFFLTPVGKGVLGKQVSKYASTYLKTTVRAKIGYRIPDWVVLEDFIIEDQSEDTLLAGKSFRVDLDMWALLQSQVKINQIEVEGVHANVYRDAGNKDFNYEFLLDAFASDTTVSDTTSNKLMLEVRNISLKNISANYRDGVSKNNARVRFNSLETGFDRLDLDSSVYYLKDINVDGLRAFVDFELLNDSATVVQTTDATPAEVAATPFNIRLQDILLNDVQWDVRIADLGVASVANVKRFLADVEGLDMDKQFVKMTSLQLDVPSLTYDDLNAPRQPKGLDYGHLALTNFKIDAEDIYGSADSVLLDLKGVKFKERSGVNVEEISGEMSYIPSAFIAKNFLIKTPNTKIGSYIEVRHPDLAKITESIERAALNIDLDKSYIGLKDIELLAPDLAKNAYFAKAKSGEIFIDGKVKGRVADLNIPNLDIRGLNGSRLLASGKIAGLPNVEKTRFDLTIKELSTSKSTLVTFLPDSIIRAYGLPDKVTLNGTLKGGTNDLTTVMTLNSDLGNGKIEGNFKNFVVEKATPKYKGSIVLNKFNVQKLLKNDSLRTVSLNLNFNGTGIDPKTMTASVNGAVNEAYFNGYTYNNIQLDAGIAQNIARFTVNSEDSNLNGNLTGTADLSSEFPSITAQGSFQRLDFKALRLYGEPLTIRGDINIDMSSTNPSSPVGTVTFGNAALDQGKGFVKLGDINLQLAEEQNQKTIGLTSDFMNLNVNGQFDYLTVADVLLTEISTYFKLPGIEFTPTTQPNNFTLTGTLFEHPLVATFVPELTDFNPIDLKASFDNTVAESITAFIEAPYVNYDSVIVKNATFNLNTTASTATYGTYINSVDVSGFRLRKATLTGDIANDNAGFLFTVKDSLDTEVHGLAGNVTVAADDIYKVAMESEGTRLYYQPWGANGTLEVHPAGIVADNVRFFYQNQELALNSQSKTPNAPIDVTSRQLDLKQLTTAFLQDSTLVSGFFNADMVVKGLDGNPGFTGDFNIKELAVTGIPVGELKANAANKGTDAIVLDASLTGEGNDFAMSGLYNLTGKNPMDFTLDIQRLGAKTIEAFSFGEIIRTSGSLNGQLKITGDPADPIIKGDVLFPDFNFVVKQLGAPYSLKNQQLSFAGQSMQMNKFTLTDSLGQSLVTTGRVLFPDLPNFSYKLNINAKDFLAVNATRGSNDYFYGKASVDASMDISGVNTNYTVNGDVKLIPGSDITVLMPEDDGEGGEMQQLITFVDRSDPTPVVEEDKERVAPVIRASSEVTLNVQVTDESQLTVLVDELTGDYLRVRGNARLRTGFNASNELFLYGDYNITDGAYELSVSFAKRKFDLLQGSYIRWTGDPMTADVNIKAAYTVQTSLNGFFQKESSLPEAVQKALERPIDVVLLLYLQNNLVNLKPSFAVGVREESLTSRGINNVDDIRSRGVSIINENGNIESGQMGRFVTDNYINQQALWLLASGRFSPAQSTDSGGFNAEAVARKSVSKLLSDQLNQLASNAIKGVDLNVGVASEYATETGERSTELNLGVSKTLLNDRLTLSVGRNFELEDAQKQSSEIFDNITASYKLTEDGRYRAKAYRKNQFQAIQGFVVETGIGFVLTVDYDQLREIFRKSEEEEELQRSINKARKEEQQKRKEEEIGPEIVRED